MNTFKCLSIRQPYAWEVVIGEKKVENKAKRTPYRGKLLIHASGSKADYEDFRKEHKDFHPSWFAFGQLLAVLTWRTLLK